MNKKFGNSDIIYGRLQEYPCKELMANTELSRFLLE